ncbi:ABC transporter substrate-binding protein [Actinomadura logoneensis]|uniref:ABC transporter substrate-binding protein n=1 Tax=Actinomadura logoneensis TaxID=2293572 RepID=UPI0013148720|nr:ABC transporter substrate-binding protein [Actinomadura logoneensis]
MSVAVAGLTGCAEPKAPSSPAAPSAGSRGGGSMITKSWGQKPVASVAALVPARFRNKPIANAIYNNFPPQEFLEGRTLVGIQPDIALALSEVMGVRLDNASVGSFDSLIPGVASGRYDMSSGDFGVTKERLGQVDFVTEFKIGTGFAVRKGSGITIGRATDLCGRSVGVQAGSYFIDQINAAQAQCASAGRGPIKLQTYPDDGARILAVSNGRVQVTATTQDALEYTIKSRNVPLDLQSFVYQPLEQAIVIPDGSDLGPAVEAAMKEIIRNGTYAKIIGKWGAQSIAYQSPNDVRHLTRPEQAA